MEQLKFDGNQVSLRNGRVLQFGYPVYDAVEVDDITLVCLNIPLDVPGAHENVFALSTDGTKMWDIEPLKGRAREDFYTGFNPPERPNIGCAYAFQGFAVDFDLHTGKVLGERFVK